MKKTEIIVRENQKKNIVIKKSGEYIVRLIGKHAHAIITGFFMGDGQKEFFLKTYQVHEAPHTTSDLLVLSVLKDNSIFSYHGVIDVKKEAQHTNAFQRNDNLLLSRTANIESKPELEIEADEVRCTHAATIGSIDSNMLFFLQSRGVNKKDAENIIVEGFLNKAKERIKHKL